MAIFSFKCPEHGNFSKYLKTGSSKTECPKCGAESTRVLGIGTVRVTEVIDNGMMHKSIERPTDIEEMMDERNAIHNKEIKGD
jgi:putative FmdB family regulatory protein